MNLIPFYAPGLVNFVPTLADARNKSSPYRSPGLVCIVCIWTYMCWIRTNVLQRPMWSNDMFRMMGLEVQRDPQLLLISALAEINKSPWNKGLYQPWASCRVPETLRRVHVESGDNPWGPYDSQHQYTKLLKQRHNLIRSRTRYSV